LRLGNREVVCENEFNVDVAVEEFVNRFIPFSVEFLETCGIPPILVEKTICEVGDFTKEVKIVLEDHVESDNGYSSHRQNDGENRLHQRHLLAVLKHLFT
jgi:hypothetical protein